MKFFLLFLPLFFINFSCTETIEYDYRDYIISIKNATSKDLELCLYWGEKLECDTIYSKDSISFSDTVFYLVKNQKDDLAIYLDDSYCDFNNIEYYSEKEKTVYDEDLNAYLSFYSYTIREKKNSSIKGCNL